jgi:glucokinase
MQKDIDKCIAGIDIGGTKIALAIATPDGKIISKDRFSTSSENGAKAILARTAIKIRELADEARKDLIGVGIACAGPLDIKSKMTINPPNLPGWENFPVGETVEEQLRVPVSFDNDANAAALGEYMYGAGRGYKNLVYITISTGIGGGVIINNQLLHGTGDGAGEVGHLTVLPDGPVCGCGSRGCLELLCSGTGIARRAKESVLSGRETSMTSLVERVEDITSSTVVDAALAGDPVARQIWNETIRLLGIGIGNILVTVSPEIVILGGGVSLTGERLLAPLREFVYSHVRILPADRIPIVTASLADESGIYGALELARQSLNT